MRYWDERPTVRKEDLPRFAWLAGFFKSTHYNWDGESYTQNRHELLLRDYFLSRLPDPAGRRILDVGCGYGEYMMVLAAMGAEVYGQDLNAMEVETGRRRFADVGLTGHFEVADATSLHYPDAFFDCVISADVYEHISPAVKRQVTAEIYRVLKPGGIAVIKTPNLSYLRLVIWMKRLLNLARLRSPFIYIAHTHDNPDNEHHGLTTYRELREIFGEQAFLPGEIVNVPLQRGRVHVAADRRLPFRSLLNEHLVMTFRKSMFVPVCDRFNGVGTPSPQSREAVR